MSMIGNYLRITPLEVQRARKDPDWAMEFAEDLEDAELDEPDSPDGKLAADRLFRTEKSWDVLRFLLERAACPVNIIYGEEEFTEGDWGYGPAWMLGPDRVGVASAFLAGVTYDELTAGVTAADLVAADLYPQGWEQPGALAAVRECFDDLTAYFKAATAAGDAMIVWLS